MSQPEVLTIDQPLTQPNEKAIIAMLLVPVVVTVINVALFFSPARAIELPSADERELVALTNQQRTEHGLKALTYNAKLHDAAEAKAKDILNKGYFEHVSPQGKTPWMFIDEAGYNYTKAGENLAIDFTTVEGPIPAWMASPGHRANILKPEYKEIGIAEATGMYNGRETTVVVQMFGTRAFDLNIFK